MAKHQLRSLIFKAAFIAGLLAVSPALRAQTARSVVSGSAQFDALPTAISPAIESSASAARASYSPQTVSTIHIPPQNTINTTEPVRNVGVESYPSRRTWLLLSAASHSAAALDAYSTRRSLAVGNIETDPMMRPFANSPAIYVAIQASPLVMDFAALKMQHSSNRFVRRLWWIPQSTGTAMSIFAGAHNLSIAHR